MQQFPNKVEIEVDFHQSFLPWKRLLVGESSSNHRSIGMALRIQCSSRHSRTSFLGRRRIVLLEARKGTVSTGENQNNHKSDESTTLPRYRITAEIASRWSTLLDNIRQYVLLPKAVTPDVVV